MLRVHKIIHDSRIYGPNARDVIWFKGCSLRCPNCINPELWDSAGSTELTVNSFISLLTSKEVTLLGGEPLEQEDIFSLIKELKKRGYAIILFTGYDMNELNSTQRQAAQMCDVVIYGRYVDELKDDSLYLIGSTNQSIILNTDHYSKRDFDKNNFFEVIIGKELEIHGRDKNFVRNLLGIKRD